MTTTSATTPATAPSDTTDTETSQRADLLEPLGKHRSLFLRTVDGLTEEQARQTPTVSTLSLGGLVKHVTAVERQWAGFVVEGPAPTPDVDWANVDWSNPPPEVQKYADGFRMLDGETLAGVLAGHQKAAAATHAPGST